LAKRQDIIITMVSRNKWKITPWHPQ
jgi:hypothetical protein